MKKIALTLASLALMTGLVAADPLQDEMLQLADVVFSGNGTVDMVEWEDFTFQVMPDVDPVDIASLLKTPGMTDEQRVAAEQLFLRGQALANLERGGKTMTGFLMGKGFTVATNDHYYSPALMFTKSGEPSRRFDFLRREGKLKLAKVTLQPSY